MCYVMELHHRIAIVYLMLSTFLQQGNVLKGLCKGPIIKSSYGVRIKTEKSGYNVMIMPYGVRTRWCLIVTQTFWTVQNKRRTSEFWPEPQGFGSFGGYIVYKFIYYLPQNAPNACDQNWIYRLTVLLLCDSSVYDVLIQFLCRRNGLCAYL